MARKIKNSILALVVLLTSVGIASALAAMKKPAERKVAQTERILVPTIEVENSNIQTTIPIIGKLSAKERIEIYAEVSGVLESSEKDFLEGVSYKKGETILSLNSDEAYQGLISKRSNLLNLVTQILPELKFDYPESHSQWYAYLINFDINAKTYALPEALNDQEKYFITGKGLYQSYYDIVSTETRMAKYQIMAPFDGVVASSNIKPGALVRNGQPLGEFFNTEVYDLETEVSIFDAKFVKIGDQVELMDNSSNEASYIGKVSRISNTIDQRTQSVKIYITIKDKSLREGQYLTGKILTSNHNLAVEIPRKLIVNNTFVLTVNDSILQEQQINIIRNNSNTAIVTGLENGIMISGKTKNLHSGIKVEIKN